ncbi:hypothetical protein PAXINDRAFT_18908 [Paxillus involutus ATCC 200175]|uniref:MIF4G domain-containing protein n=1 Tax=Paxillus involutus ATCC 200175 TaxID=664439 RepID=A0A0C9SXV6_PAXIN|nr:hypothetical protein PAXINDRAFT_18908 [Paxillus involutus ATCC 200175]
MRHHRQLLLTPAVQVGSIRQGPAVPFGSIDDVAAPLPGSSKLPARPALSVSKAGIAKLFQGSSPAYSPPLSDTSSPSTRSSNGTGTPPRPLGDSGGPGGLPIPASPRLALHHSYPHQAPAGVAPQQVPVQPMPWGACYYPVGACGQPASPHPHSGVPQGPSHSGIAMSPRNPPLTPPPGKPTMAHAVPHTPRTPPPPPPKTYQPLGSISTSSPPRTPSTASGPSTRTLNTNPSTLVPTTRMRKAIVIKSEDGTVVSLESLKKHGRQPPIVPIPPASLAATGRRTMSVRIESEEARRKREAKARLEKEKKEAAERAGREEQERKRKEEGEAKRKAEEEAVRTEEQEKEWGRKVDDARLGEGRKGAQEEKEHAERKAEQREQREALEREGAQLEADKAQDIFESTVDESKTPEEGEVTENGELTEPPVNGNSVSKPAEGQKEALQIDTSSMPPPLGVRRRRPGPRDISAAKRENSVTPLSALAMVKNIERLQDVHYPEGVRGPKEDLNKDAKNGKFRYDRDFLMQFMQVCKERPLNLPRLDALGIEPTNQTSLSVTPGGSGRHRKGSGAMALSTPRQDSVGFGIIDPFLGEAGASATPFAMGQFSMPTSKLTNEEPFMLATGTRFASVGGAPASLQYPSTATSRTPSQGGPGGHSTGSKHTRSKRGRRCNETDKVVLSQEDLGHCFGAPGAVPILVDALEPVTPLEVSANRWAATSTARNPITANADPPELVDRTVRSLLNELTMEKFDFISDQIIAWANKSEDEKDARTLIQIIKLLFEKAADDAVWSEMYARLCRKMMQAISPKVQDDGIRNTNGKPIAGGQLFRKCLLNRCQEDFEHGWFAKETTAAAAAVKASNDQATKAANNTMGEKSLYSGEYCAAQKARRQGLGLIKLVGELFKLQILTERIIHEYVKKFLGNAENSEEEGIEGLCQLLKMVGQQLDVPKAQARMDVYFARMKGLLKNLNVSPRIQFMLQDVIELRERRWVARGGVGAPSTIVAFDEAFAKLGKDAPMAMCPSNVFAGKKDTKRDSLSQTNSSTNMVSMVSQNPELATDATAKASRLPSQTLSAAFGQIGLPELPMQRRKRQLLPHTRPIVTEETLPPSEGQPEAPAHVSEADQIDEDLKEFFAAPSLEEADLHFTKLPQQQHFRLVDKLVASAVESKEVDALVVGELLAQAASQNQCSLDVRGWLYAYD